MKKSNVLTWSGNTSYSGIAENFKSFLDERIKEGHRIVQILPVISVESQTSRTIGQTYLIITETENTL